MVNPVLVIRKSAAKPLNTSQLVKKLINVTREGKTYHAMRWVRPNEATSQKPKEPKDSAGRLLAPNGKPSHLNETQWYRVRTPEFKKWFGDWEVAVEIKEPASLTGLPVNRSVHQPASRIIDENGEPLVVYKGMMKNDWETKKEIESIDSPNGPWAGFFTDKKDIAEKFQQVYSTMGEAVLHSVYLSIKNPYVYDAQGARAHDVMFDDTLFGKNPKNPGPSAAFNRGYDGIIIKNTADEGTVYIPKNPSQIKSINANEFDPNSPNFNKSLDRSRLVKKPVMVTRNGRIFYQTKWVRAGEETQEKRKDATAKDAAATHEDEEERTRFDLGKPALNPKQISELAQISEYGLRGDYSDLVHDAERVLEKAGVDFIDAYHVVRPSDIDQVKATGLKGSEWYGKPSGVYFFADPDDIEKGYDYLNMKKETEGREELPVVHFRIPKRDIKNLQWDGYFNVTFGTYSAFLCLGDISPEQIIEVKYVYLEAPKDADPGKKTILNRKGDEVGENSAVPVKKSLTFSGWKLQGRRKVQGMDVSIENKKGSIRRGKDKDGHEWATKMHADYGYIRGTVGKDKDHLDAYVGPNPDSTKVFIIHQNDPVKGTYDEDKVMLGFDTAEEAKALYLKQYDRPGFFGSMDETDVETFKERAFADSTKGKKLVIKKSESEAINAAKKLVIKAIGNPGRHSAMMEHVKDVVDSIFGAYTNLGLSSSERRVFDSEVQQELAEILDARDGKKVRNGTAEELKPRCLDVVGELNGFSHQIEDEIERKYPKELEVGIRVEKEHTDDLKTAKIIAMAHIKERPDYYTKLIAAGLVDEPEAIKMAKKIGIAKALPKAGDVENSHQSPPKGYPKEKKEYADPNNYKYPLDTEEHVRAAIAYFSKPSNYSVYPVSVRRSIWNRIMRAAREYGIVISDQDKFKKSNILFVSPLRQRAERVRGVVVRVLQKAKKSSRLVPVKKNVVRDGRTYSATYWILPEQVSEFQHGNNIEGRKPISVQLDLFDQPPAEEPEVRDKQIAQAINMATPETRARVAEFIAKADIAEETPMPKEEEYRFMPSERNVGTIGNLVVGTIKDYTGVVPKRIFLVPKNKILYVEKPSWVPEVDERFFEQQKGRLPFVKTGNNEYLVQLADQDKPENERYAIVNLDVLVATNDFYLKKVRAAQDIKIKAEQELRKMRVEEELHRLQEKFRNGEVPEDKRRIWQHDIEYYQKILSGKIKIKSSIKPLRLMGDKKMTYTQMGLLVDVNNGVRSRDKTWGVYGSNLREYNQKLSDMEIQQEDLLSSYVKGRETSYGDKKTRKDLLDKYGVLVKRQNGSDITQEEIGAIKDALDSVFAVYGDRSSMARRFGLKISHSGEKLMHARNALGVFIPYYRAIGVTARLGDKHMGFTLSHEWAHFMDHYLGGDKFHFSSDEIGSLSNVIADRFRNNMQKRQTSDYQQRTCECFARAFEEYFSIKTGDSDTLLAGSSKEGNYVEPEFFKKDIAPLIESFFEQNSSMLKAMKVSIRNLK